MEQEFEIAIVGSGPAGLGAATNAAKHGVSHVLLERNEIANTIYDYQLRKLVMAEPRRLPLRAHLPFEEGSREEVLNAFEHAIKENAVNVLKVEVAKIQKVNEYFKIFYDKEVLQARHVVLAIGTMGTPRKLEVPGENLPHVVYTLADPDAFQGMSILVVGAGDSAIENALALSVQNAVSLVNRSAEFPRAKDANRAKILHAIKSGKIRCFYDATVTRVDKEETVISTSSGDVTVRCNHVIIRVGSILPRKFVEGCGIVFPSAEVTAVPVVSERYESNVKGLYIVGALIGYPLIKQAINQGFEVIEHILGNSVEPADQVLLQEVLEKFPGSVNDILTAIHHTLTFFKDLSQPQFREMIADSKLHLVEEGDLIFARNDYTDTLWSVVSGSVGGETPEDPTKLFQIGSGNFFGEMGLISGRRRVRTIRALERSVLLETKRNQILKLMSSVPSLKDGIDRVFLLRTLKASIFPDADPAFLAELSEKAKRVDFKKGDVFFREGEEGDALYVILKGSVKISRKNKDRIDVAQTYLAAGNYVGEMALVSTEPRNSTVTAVVPCYTLKISKEDFIQLLNRSPQTKKDVMRVVAERWIENLTSVREVASGEALDFVLSQGISDADNVLLIDSDLCIGCDNCEKACAATHNGYSRLDRKGGKSFASIQVPISCRHCENPLCMLDCPPDALERTPNGEIAIKDNCIGCGNCVTNCPYSVIQLVYDKPQDGFSILRLMGLEKKDKGPAKAAKCDLCEHLESGPACVRSCPTGAVLRVNPTEMMTQLLNRQESGRG